MTSELLAAIDVIAEQLNSTGQQFVFVGGSVVELYLKRDYAEAVRPTDDIDCIVRISSKAAQHHLEEQLRALYFENDRFTICRWHYDKIVIDIMPTDAEILSFSNPWYEHGFDQRETFVLPSGREISLLPICYFLATKFEAYQGRGINDPRQSKDLEDIFLIIDGFGPNLIEKCKEHPKPLAFLSSEFQKLKQLKNFSELLLAILPYGARSRTNQIMSIVSRIIDQ